MTSCLILCCAVPSGAQERDAQEGGSGYPTVEAAQKAVQAKPGIVLTQENGWLIATDEGALTIWSFAPKGYPAYPAVVKRWVTPDGEGSQVHMSVHCEAPKPACDDLVLLFKQMNGFDTAED
jgi:hypothetical protein